MKGVCDIGVDHLDTAHEYTAQLDHALVPPTPQYDVGMPLGIEYVDVTSAGGHSTRRDVQLRSHITDFVPWPGHGVNVGAECPAVYA